MRVHVMEQGEGRPVVLFHGNPTWGYLYRKVAAELDDEPLRLVLPDLMGLGFSDRVPPGRFTLNDHINWIADLLNTLRLGEATAVVHDWGGAIGVGAFFRSETSMAGLVVMNTGLGPPKPGFRPTTFHRIFSTPGVAGLARRLGLIEKNMARVQGDRRSISGEVRDAYFYPLRWGGNDAVIDFVRMVPDSIDHPSVGPLGEVGDFVAAYDGPAAIVWGKKDPILGRLLNRTRRALPQADVTVTDAGHFVQEEVPVEIAAAIRRVAFPRV